MVGKNLKARIVRYMVLKAGMSTVLLLLYCIILKHQYNILWYSPPPIQYIVIFSSTPRLLPVTVARQTQHYIEITARPLHSHIYTKPDKVISPQVQAQSMIQHIQQLPAVLRNALGHCYFPPNMSDLVTEFNNQTLVIASDGSMAHNTATQAWVLYGTSTESPAYGGDKKLL